jgi:hypothetical protein
MRELSGGLIQNESANQENGGSELSQVHGTKKEKEEPI